MSEEVKHQQVHPYPLTRVPHDKVKYFSEGMQGWHFVFVNDAPLAKSIDSAAI